MTETTNPKVWFSSDLHFGHTNILKFCPESRPYTTVDDMNDAIINNFNAVIAPDDHLYLLGDIAFCSASKAADYLAAMNGKKFLIIGNHDHKALKDKKFRSQFESIDHYKEIHLLNGPKKVPVMLLHYPCYSWNRMHHGAYHLYGHVHGKHLEGMRGRHLDVGLDSKHMDGSYMKPFSEEEIHQMLWPIESNPHHG